MHRPLIIVALCGVIFYLAGIAPERCLAFVACFGALACCVRR